MERRIPSYFRTDRLNVLKEYAEEVGKYDDLDEAYDCSKVKVRTLDDQISAIRRTMREFQQENRKVAQLLALRTLGKCYECENKMVMVIDVPEEEPRMTQNAFNEYQLPCIYLHKDKTDFFEAIEKDTIHRDLFNRKSCVGGEWHEIPFERFFECISERMAEFTCYLEQVRSVADEVAEISKSC